MIVEREPIYRICQEEGIGIMVDVFDIILDRDEATVEQIVAFLDDGDRHVFALYENFIAPGIDRLSDYINEES
jgi:hypothetical protein